MDEESKTFIFTAMLKANEYAQSTILSITCSVSWIQELNQTETEMLVLVLVSAKKHKPGITLQVCLLCGQ